MGIYEQVRSVPQTALKEIEGGPMKGKSNINPQWRIEMLTRLFGPAGIGWKIEQVARWSESTPRGEVAVFCEVNLYVKKDGQWSEPIFGQGGNKLVSIANEYENGKPVPVLKINDEAYKMAYTDAISVACKALGFAGDIYFHQEMTKYGDCWDGVPMPAQVVQPAESQEWPWKKGLKELTPKSANWAASQTQVSMMGGESPSTILQRISSKFNITRENFELLLSTVAA